MRRISVCPQLSVTVRVTRNTSAGVTADDHADEREHRGETDDDHGRHRCQAETDRGVVYCVNELLSRSSEVPYLVHVAPTM